MLPFVESTPTMRSSWRAAAERALANALYMASSLADVSAAKVIKPVLLIILFAYVPTLILTTYIPQIATFLPNLITG